MQHQFSDQTAHFSIPSDFAEFVEAEIDKLDPIVHSFPDTLLRVVVDDASGTDEVEILLRLSLPSKLLTSRETGSADHIRSVFGKALKDLRRQLLDFKAQL